MYRQVLSALAKCDGIEEYTILNHVDIFDRGQLVPLFKSIDEKHPIKLKCKGIITDVAPRPMGNAMAIHRAWQQAFAQYDNPTPEDFPIYLEDDDIPGKDWIRYMEWANKRISREAKKDEAKMFDLVQKRLQRQYRRAVQNKDGHLARLILKDIRDLYGFDKPKKHALTDVEGEIDFITLSIDEAKRRLLATLGDNGRTDKAAIEEPDVRKDSNGRKRISANVQK